MKRGRFTEDYLGYYVFLGRNHFKKVKKLVFYPGVPGAVWDRKIHALMTRLPYFRAATAEEIAELEASGKARAPKGKAASKPAPASKDQNADRDALRAELDRRGIAYHHKHGPKKLLELLENAPLIASTPEPAMAEA